MITSGRGYSYPTAREAALKLMETAYVSAQPFPVLAVVPAGAGGEAFRPVLDVLAERNADVLAVASAGASAPLPQTADPLAPLLEILPFQLLARHVAVDRGGDPDAPRGLHKVTETL